MGVGRFARGGGFGLRGLGVVSVVILLALPDAVHAVAAAEFFGSLPRATTAFTALLYLLAVAIIGLGVLKSLSLLGNGDLALGMIGMFSSVAASIFAFTLIPSLTAAGIALGATLR